MPDWLLKKDNYIPEKDKDTFINKSILSLLGVISKFTLGNRKKRENFKLNPITLILSNLLLILMLSLSRSFFFVLTINVVLLFIISILTIEEIKNIFGLSLVTTIFTFLILIPSMFMGNTNNSFLIILKVMATVTSVNLMSHVTEWQDITGTLRLLHVPDLFIFVLDITIKYIVVLGEFSLNLLYALKLRSIGKSKNNYTSLSGILGTTFMKSKEMAEEMHSAMECRGFTGEYKNYIKYKFTFRDVTYMFIFAIIVLLYLYFR